MCAKHLEKKNKKTGKRAARWVPVVVLAVVLIALLLLWRGLYNTQEPDETRGTDVTRPSQSVSSGEETTDTQPQDPGTFEEVEKTSVNLGRGMSITDVGKYTGVYMEDGTDELVSGVLMIVVTNSGEETIQYAEITLPVSTGEAKFSLSTLPVGQSVVLLEQNRLEWSADEEYASAVAENVAVFSEPLSLCEDRLALQILDGAINVSNISGRDITGDIVIYYKNSTAELYYGGITYRVRIEGGLKADEIRQIMASHFSDTGSEIMFVTIGQ